MRGRQRHSVVVGVVDSRLLFDECEAISEFRRSGVVNGRQRPSLVSEAVIGVDDGRELVDRDRQADNGWSRRRRCRRSRAVGLSLYNSVPDVSAADVCCRLTSAIRLL